MRDQGPLGIKGHPRRGKNSSNGAWPFIKENAKKEGRKEEKRKEREKENKRKKSSREEEKRDRRGKVSAYGGVGTKIISKCHPLRASCIPILFYRLQV